MNALVIQKPQRGTRGKLPTHVTCIIVVHLQFNSYRRESAHELVSCVRFERFADKIRVRDLEIGNWSLIEIVPIHSTWATLSLLQHGRYYIRAIPCAIYLQGCANLSYLSAPLTNGPLILKATANELLRVSVRLRKLELLYASVLN